MRPRDDTFEAHRAELERLAYRMLGSLADADDVLQDAYLRWSGAHRSSVRSPRDYLAAVVTRLCIDRRQAIEERKKTYIGQWLPEPLVDPGRDEPARRLETAESVSMALMVVLESLSPFERAAYLLRRIFDFGYDEVADVLGKTEVACRQLVSRAEARIQERRPRFQSRGEDAERLTTTFLEACTTGDMNGLLAVLATDAALYADGGGKALAALAPIHGADRVARFFLGIARKAPENVEIRAVRVNGQPGFLARHEGQVVQVLAFDIVDGRIGTIFAIRNPEKLERVAWTTSSLSDPSSRRSPSPTPP